MYIIRNIYSRYRQVLDATMGIVGPSLLRSCFLSLSHTFYLPMSKTAGQQKSCPLHPFSFSKIAERGWHVCLPTSSVSRHIFQTCSDLCTCSALRQHLVSSKNCARCQMAVQPPIMSEFRSKSGMSQVMAELEMWPLRTRVAKSYLNTTC
jgi:hypothetical protein